MMFKFLKSIFGNNRLENASHWEEMESEKFHLRFSKEEDLVLASDNNESESELISPVAYFYIVISAADYVVWKNDEECESHPMLATAFALLNISVKPSDLYEEFFKRVQSGTGDFHLYKTHSSANILGVDFYTGLTDQHDSCRFIVKATNEIDKVRIALRSFYDDAGDQHCYEEKYYSPRCSNLISEANYPKIIHDDYGHRHKQELHVFDLS